MRHCPECDRSYSHRSDFCPDCWEPLERGARSQEARLQLVFESSFLYEAEMMETLLTNEGIPCLKIPGYGSVLAPLASVSPQIRTRLYVHPAAAVEAIRLIQEVTAGSRPTSEPER